MQEGSWATELGVRDLNLPPTCSHLALGKHCSRGVNFLIGHNRSSYYAEFVRSLESGARDKAESNKAANDHSITYQIASLKGGTLNPDSGCGVREGIAEEQCFKQGVKDEEVQTRRKECSPGSSMCKGPEAGVPGTGKKLK